MTVGKQTFLLHSEPDSSFGTIYQSFSLSVSSFYEFAYISHESNCSGQIILCLMIKSDKGIINVLQ